MSVDLLQDKTVCAYTAKM